MFYLSIYSRVRATREICNVTNVQYVCVLVRWCIHVCIFIFVVRVMLCSVVLWVGRVEGGGRQEGGRGESESESGSKSESRKERARIEIEFKINI